MSRKSIKLSVFLMVSLIETSGCHSVVMLDVIQCMIHTCLSALNLYENESRVNIVVVSVNTCYATNRVSAAIGDLDNPSRSMFYVCASGLQGMGINQ